MECKKYKKNPFELYKNLTFIMDKKTSNNSLTVYENILFWCRLFSSKIKIKEIDAILDLLYLYQYKNTPINQLSYGEIKKLELSRLIIEHKKLWILDEPYIGLDNISTNLVNQTIVNHASIGGMIIFTSHTIPEIPTLHTLIIENNA